MAVITQSLYLQLMVVCSASLCWGYNCSSGGDSGSELRRCGISNWTNLEEAVAVVMGNVSLVFPRASGVKGSGKCDLKCWDPTAPGGSGSRNASTVVDEIIKNLNKLTLELEISLNKTRSKGNLETAVMEFMVDRDWPKLKAVLKTVLEPSDPALNQALQNSWTDGKDALRFIVISSHKELLETLLDYGLDANLPWGTNNSTMLHEAATVGDIDAAEVLLSRGAHVDAKADWNVTPLLRAAFVRQPDMVRWLLERGANVHATDTHLWTALHFAAKKDDLPTVKILLEYGAVKEALNEREHTPHDEATAARATKVLEILAPEDPFPIQVDPQ